jgi:hypothetical protein
MISKQEAERIRGKPVVVPRLVNINSTSLYDWLEDIPILLFPDIAPEVLSEEAEFIVHPGFYYRLSEFQCKGYSSYLDRLKSETQSFLGKKPVLVWTPVDYKKETLRILGINRDSAILVPTESFGMKLINELLRMEDDEFLKELSVYVKLGNVNGEAKYGCARGLKRRCEHFNIKTQIVENLTYV